VKRKQIMLIAGEASGDTLAAELVGALRRDLSAADDESGADPQPLRAALEPRFFGAGGPGMKAAGVELAFDLTEHSVIGLAAATHYLKFRRLFDRLFRIALERQPDAIVCVDFGLFNRRFAQAIRRHAARARGPFHDWRPKIIQYVSPQVWASRENRAYQIARDYDLLLSIFPFEKEWYARRLPRFPVEFVGHPIVDRFADLRANRQPAALRAQAPRILLLPGSRSSELRRHVPVMRRAVDLMRARFPNLRVRMVLPHEALIRELEAIDPSGAADAQHGGLPEALAEADLAIASTGTVTMECAWFGVPTVTLYKAAWMSYRVARLVVKVKSLTMPNLLANEQLYPEFIQGAATPEALSGAALELLQNETRRADVQAKLSNVIASLGGPGAVRRASQAVVRLMAGEA
jgi:lipid-A-disaccharide synthase